jgi:hypothetical protein
MKKQDLIKSHSEFTLYQTEDGQTRIQCRFENEAFPFKAIFFESELTDSSTCKDDLQVQTMGVRQIKRRTPFTQSL